MVALTYWGQRMQRRVCLTSTKTCIIAILLLDYGVNEDLYIKLICNTISKDRDNESYMFA